MFEIMIWAQGTNNFPAAKCHSFVKGSCPAYFTMTSSAGSSRLLVVCCCVLITSVFLYCVGYVRLELELRAYKERLEALEQREKELAATPVPTVPANGKSIKVWFLYLSTSFVLFLRKPRKLQRSFNAFVSFSNS